MGKPLLLPIRHCPDDSTVFQSVDWLTEPYFFDIVFPLHFISQRAYATLSAICSYAPRPDNQVHWLPTGDLLHQPPFVYAIRRFASSHSASAITFASAPACVLPSALANHPPIP
jgi:hypothetical protein